MSNDGWIFRGQTFQFGLEPLAGLAGVVGQVVALDDLEDFEGDRTSQRRTAVSSTM